MTSYRIDLIGDTLKVDFAKTPDGTPVVANGDEIVRDAATRLREMIDRGEIKGGNLLKINGRISVALSYTIAHEIAHLYRAIAVSDTRLGAYVVVITTTDDYPIGSQIDFETGKVTQVCSLPNTPPSFLIYWEDDVLIARINNTVKADGDQIAVDAYSQLQNLINSGQLSGGKPFLKINGRATVLASFLIAYEVGHKYGAVAVFDPKIGDRGLDRYIVTINHSKNYQVGETFDINYQPQPNVKVVLCGPANTGKTVFKDGLKAAILKLNHAPDDFYVISGCPDGDGSWHGETAQKYPKLAEELKAEYKAKFTPEFAQGKARDIKAIKNSLLVFDVGGKISDENITIMSEATHAVILAKTPEDVAQWQNFCEIKLERPLPIIAIIYSDYAGKEDKIITEEPVLTGSVHYLERGQNVSNRPMIKALAELLVSLAINCR
ncbi:hypothetical protein Cri9333_0593 [Crinalium epipsammum PCC 9333]|uniref:CRISPR-associated protein, Csx3 family n=1 Tax=Crinalium epipsammum PCC 9333 TaxID=1173022 RepID=K9VVH3_9CYAN|nr:CRISPR-associated protein Csx3 [Crinalium epipsammum]AFZ11539.1 hypothetical protein Cri9333_0593 [Crinalium epipsammum PCC 9333]